MAQQLCFRVSQLLLVLVCALREWVNVFTDVGQFQNTTRLAHRIMSFPTPDKVSTLFNRSIEAMWVAKGVALLWIVVHLTVASLLTYGMIILLIHRHVPSQDYQEKKCYSCLGLALGLFAYFFLIGLMSMDYFLSWMQHMDYNGDIVGYGLPLFVTLVYLLVTDLSPESTPKVI